MIKKHFKKLVSVALTAVMALGMTTTAFANEKDTLNLDAALMEKGYPQIVLDTMDEDTKMDIYNEGDIAFCGAVITYYDENSGTYSEIDVNEDGTYIAPRGQISTSDLSLSLRGQAVPGGLRHRGKLPVLGQKALHRPSGPLEFLCVGLPGASGKAHH